MTAPQEWLDWRAARHAALVAPDGWLNLIDRVEAGPGPQSVGQGAGNDLVLSAGPEHLGVLRLTPEAGDFTTPDGVLHRFLRGAGNPQLTLQSLLLELHSADGSTALRVRDISFKPQILMTYFDYDPLWNIHAAWVPFCPIMRCSAAAKGTQAARMFHKGS